MSIYDSAIKPEGSLPVESRTFVTERKGIYDLIEAEREKQDAKWGEQNHLMGTGSYFFQAQADAYKKLYDKETAVGGNTWSTILLEEVYEALSEGHPFKLEAELIQVAAVAVAMIECLRRHRK